MSINIVENQIHLVEKYIEKLEEVVSCKFVLDDKEEIEELHIVSNGRRSPKQISRDIQSILIASYGIYIDYKKISIAEIPDLSLRKASQRLIVDKVSYEEKSSRISITVGLENNGQRYDSTSEGANISSNIDKMVAEATMDAIKKAHDLEDILILEDIKTINLTRTQVVVVVITCLLNNNQKSLCGSSVIEENSKMAVVRAVLDATNRYICNN